MKIKYMGSPFLLSEKYVATGDILKVDKIFHCIEHYAVWFYNKNNVDLSQISKNCLKHDLPIVVCQGTPISRVLYNIYED